MEIIHIVLGKANPNRLNGVNKVVHNLATAQANAGLQVQIWGVTKDTIHDYPYRPCTTQLFLAHTNPFSVPQSLSDMISANTHAIYHLHGGWVPLNSALSKIFRKKDIKFVLTPHGAYNKHAMLRNAWIKKIYFHWFEKPLLEAAYKIHSIGASEVDGLNSIYPNAPTLLLPYGFDMSLVKNNMHVSQTFTIGYMGRLDTHTKGLDLLIQAFDIFHKGYKNSRLWIIGDGTGAPYLHKYIKNKNLNSVVMWGKKFGEEKEALMRQLHVFAHPSRNEGLPNAVLEAAALGIPSIVSKATNVDKYITEFKAGIAIEDNSLCALVNAFQEMYISFENGQMSYYHDGPRKMLKQIFDWPILVEKYMALYH